MYIPLLPNVDMYIYMTLASPTSRPHQNGPRGSGPMGSKSSSRTSRRSQLGRAAAKASARAWGVDRRRILINRGVDCRIERLSEHLRQHPKYAESANVNERAGASEQKDQNAALYRDRSGS